MFEVEGSNLVPRDKCQCPRVSLRHAHLDAEIFKRHINEAEALAPGPVAIVKSPTPADSAIAENLQRPYRTIPANRPHSS